MSYHGIGASNSQDDDNNLAGEILTNGALPKGLAVQWKNYYHLSDAELREAVRKAIHESGYSPVDIGVVMTMPTVAGTWFAQGASVVRAAQYMAGAAVTGGASMVAQALFGHPATWGTKDDEIKDIVRQIKIIDANKKDKKKLALARARAKAEAATAAARKDAIAMAKASAKLKLQDKAEAAADAAAALASVKRRLVNLKAKPRVSGATAMSPTEIDIAEVMAQVNMLSAQVVGTGQEVLQAQQETIAAGVPPAEVKEEVTVAKDAEDTANGKEPSGSDDSSSNTGLIVGVSAAALGIWFLLRRKKKG